MNKHRHQNLLMSCNQDTLLHQLQRERLLHEVYKRYHCSSLVNFVYPFVENLQKSKSEGLYLPEFPIQISKDSMFTILKK